MEDAVKQKVWIGYKIRGGRWIPNSNLVQAAHSFNRVREIKKTRRRVCPPARQPAHIEQLGSQWTDFHEIWYFSNFWKSVEKIQALLKYDKNNGNFT